MFLRSNITKYINSEQQLGEGGIKYLYLFFITDGVEFDLFEMYLMIVTPCLFSSDRHSSSDKKNNNHFWYAQDSRVSIYLIALILQLKFSFSFLLHSNFNES